MQAYDLLIIGGGINGTGIARDAAGRGLSVLLCEKDDLAQHTSSRSTKLIHGGLRYLEYYEFGLVRKALQEREVLLRSAPHIMGPLRFVMPHDKHLRPAWLIRAGMFLYDHLAKRKILYGSRAVDLREHVAGQVLNPRFKKGFIYSDGWVQDARLVTLCAMDAHERGAQIRTRCAVVKAVRHSDHWQVTLHNSQTGDEQTVITKILVNAAGPWVADFLHLAQVTSTRKIRLVKGSHIVVPKLFEHHYAYIFQNPDHRIIFAIPYEDQFTLIGTTDVEYLGDPSKVAIDADEVGYLCEMASRYFKQTIQAADVRWHYSGVRPLLDDEASNAASVTRDYELVMEQSAAPVLSVFGGKITTFRKLSEEATDSVQALLGKGSPAWTVRATLPGGDLPGKKLDTFIAEQRQALPWLPPSLLERYARAYGSRMQRLLGNAKNLADLGPAVAPGIYEAELRYLIAEEFVTASDDVLWRRSKLGLHLDSAEQAAVHNWFASHQHCVSE